MSKPLIWTSIAAVLVSSFSLAASGWVIANERGGHRDHSVEPVANAPALSSASRTLDDSNADDAPDLPTAAKPAVNEVPKSEPKAEPTVHADATDLKVRRLVVASGVENREPVGSSDAFRAGDDRVYAFVEMANRSSHDGGIVIVFENGSTRTGMVELEIPGDVGRWRTWGYTRALRQPGTWNVVVREQDTGKELARTSIEVTKAGEAPATDTPPVIEPASPASVAAKVVEQPVTDGTI